MTTMSTHQAISHMKGLLSAQAYILTSASRSISKNLTQARAFLVQAKQEMSVVKEAVDRVREGSAPLAMLKMFLEQLEHQWDDEDKELALLEKGGRMLSAVGGRTN